jgi:hypothetical protein
MSPRTRVVCSAFGFLLRELSFGAETESLPQIFVPRAEVTVAATQSWTPQSEMANRVHQVVMQKALAKGKTFVALPAAASDEPPATATQASTVVMEKLVVRAFTGRVIELPEPLSPALNFLRHGILFRSSIGKIETDGTIEISRVYSERSGSNGTETRGEIRFNLRW